VSLVSGSIGIRARSSVLIRDLRMAARPRLERESVSLTDSLPLLVIYSIIDHAEITQKDVKTGSVASNG